MLLCIAGRHESAPANQNSLGHFSHIFGHSHEFEVSQLQGCAKKTDVSQLVLGKHTILGKISSSRSMSTTTLFAPCSICIASVYEAISRSEHAVQMRSVIEG